MKTLQQRYGQRMTMGSVMNYHLPIGTKVSVEKVKNNEGKLVCFRNGRVASDSFEGVIIDDQKLFFIVDIHGHSGSYRRCVNKIDIYCGDYVVKVLRNAA
nr:MAG TPA: metallophosphatase domain protein [Caudoviricetes sp.]